MSVTKVTTFMGILFFGWVSILTAGSEVVKTGVQGSFPKLRPALFAKVTNVADDDVLNIRKKPDYRSEIIGEAYPAAIVGVDFCLEKNTSTWCRIYNINTIDPMKTGWSNARFLDLEHQNSNRGYVEIVGRAKSCFYSVKCEVRDGRKVCMVTNSLDYDVEMDSISKPETEWIDREKLRASSAFDSAAEDAKGYCTNGVMIDDFLQQHPNSLD